VTTGTSASLMGCLIEGNSIALWLSPAGQACVEKCLFRRNAYGCLWSGEGARNETAPRRNETVPAPGAALDPDSAPQDPSHRQQHPPRRGVRSRGRSRSCGDMGHVTLNLVQNTIHGRLWVSPCSLSFPPHLLPPPCSDSQSLANDLVLPGLCRPSHLLDCECRPLPQASWLFFSDYLPLSVIVWLVGCGGGVEHAAHAGAWRRDAPRPHSQKRFAQKRLHR
jgi:hypothetical protein